MYLIKSDYDLKLPNKIYTRKKLQAMTKQKIFKRKNGMHFLKAQKKGDNFMGFGFLSGFVCLFVLHFHCQPKLKRWFRSHIASQFSLITCPSQRQTADIITI